VRLYAELPFVNAASYVNVAVQILEDFAVDDTLTFGYRPTMLRTPTPFRPLKNICCRLRMQDGKVDDSQNTNWRR
jgi:hypothetical protein